MVRSSLNVLRAVVEKRQKLEVAWLDECATLKQPTDRRVLRDITSGTLRHLDYYARLVDYNGSTAISDNVPLRLLVASTLYQQQHMQRAPPLQEFHASIVECCKELGERPSVAPAVFDLCEKIYHLNGQQTRESLTQASTFSLPVWMVRPPPRACSPPSASILSVTPP